jgi:ASC-1-like (ASCH) protein
MAIVYEKHLSEPWFSLIKVGIKTVEGRLNRNDINAIHIGDVISFYNNDFGFSRKFKVEITNFTLYESFRSYLEVEQLSNCLPGIDTIEEGISVYRKYYNEVDELTYGIKALKFRLV